jgi:hypothetical protein
MEQETYTVKKNPDRLTQICWKADNYIIIHRIFPVLTYNGTKTKRYVRKWYVTQRYVTKRYVKSGAALQNGTWFKTVHYQTVLLQLVHVTIRLLQNGTLLKNRCRTVHYRNAAV